MNLDPKKKWKRWKGLTKQFCNLPQIMVNTLFFFELGMFDYLHLYAYIFMLTSLCLHLYANTCLIQMNWIDCLLIRFTNIYRVNPTISLLELYYYVYKILLKRISMFILLFFLPDDSLTTRRSARLRSTTPISGTNSGSEDSSQVQQKMTILMFYI